MIKIEKNIPIPSSTNASYLSEEEKNLIRTMDIGDSFLIAKYSHIGRLRQYAKSMGMELIARKNYTGTTRNEFNYRVWYSKKITPVAKVYPHNKLKELGILPPKSVTSRKGMINNPSGGEPTDGIHLCDQSILDIAELKEENRQIVDDMVHIKKVLKEELGHTNTEYKQKKWSR